MSLHIVCPQCQAVNRVPAERLTHSPECGRCQRPLFTGKPVNANATEFERYLSRNDIPLLVDFWAPWCGPCRMMAPAFEQAAAQLEPHFRLLKIDTEQEPMLGARFGVRSIPTLAVFHHGREVQRQSGAMNVPTLVQWARRAQSQAGTA